MDREPDKFPFPASHEGKAVKEKQNEKEKQPEKGRC
jgi:hypothetical protein